MGSWRGVVHIECQSCATEMTLSVVLAEERDALVEQAINELLVDYGWLPTSWGRYCRAHAPSVRNGRGDRRW